ncbi:restriction endonuclease subunit S [Paenibacillus solisilvae]|uniref:Restriction endonuclease subunit S n=1 Tax=Paenibacillus solisilvae TaxID=2486751 RepID=A0ABW0VVK6_9BACL
MSIYRFYKKADTSVAIAKIVFNHLFSVSTIKKISDIAGSTSGGTPSRSMSEYYNGDIPWIKSGELNDGIITSCEEFISDLGLKNSSAKIYPKGSLVLALYGATVGKTGIIGFEAASNQAVCAIFPNGEVDNDYLFWFLRQKRQEFIASSFGGAQPNISQKVVKDTLLPVPDLDIQKQVASFLYQCEKDGTINSDFVLKETLENIDKYYNITLCCDELESSMELKGELLSNLRQSILQEAVQGKLVPQDPNDEPASVLLEKIKAEKEQLINDKKIKKEKPLPKIAEDKILYELPQGWEWVRFQDILHEIKYGTSKKCQYETGNTPVLRIPNIKNGGIDFSDLKYTDLSESEREELALEENDLLMIRSNGSSSLVGRIARISSNAYGFSYAGYLVRLRCAKSFISINYLLLAFNSKLIRNQIEVPIRTTSGVKNINTNEISKLVFPLPPLEEQKRIVEKVFQYMAVCNELEKTVEQSKQDSEMLMQFVLQEAFQSA